MGRGKHVSQCVKHGCYLSLTKIISLIERQTKRREKKPRTSFSGVKGVPITVSTKGPSKGPKSTNIASLGQNFFKNSPMNYVSSQLDIFAIFNVYKTVYPTEKRICKHVISLNHL